MSAVLSRSPWAEEKNEEELGSVQAIVGYSAQNAMGLTEYLSIKKQETKHFLCDFDWLKS